MRTPETYKVTMDAFEEQVGLRYIRAFHVNDSREGCGAHRDLHKNIGEWPVKATHGSGRQDGQLKGFCDCKGRDSSA